MIVLQNCELTNFERKWVVEVGPLGTHQINRKEQDNVEKFYISKINSYFVLLEKPERFR